MGARIAAWSEAPRTLAFVGGAAVLVCAGFAAVVYFQLPSPVASTAIDDVGEALAALTAAAACAWGASQTAGRIRVGWTLLSISAAAWAAGETVWSVYEVGLGQPVPYP